MPALRKSTALLYGVAIPLVSTLVIWIYYCKLDPYYLVEGVAFRLYTLLFLSLLVYKIVCQLLSRSIHLAAIYCGILLITLQGVVWYGYRFSGMAAVGADEQITEYYISRAGAFTSSPRIPQKVVNVTAEPKSVTLVRDGIETRLDAGKSVQLDGFMLRLTEVEQAPLVAVRNVRGEPVDEAYLKLTSSGEREDFIMFGRLPHRFYVKGVREPESGVEMFRIKVVRDKLTIVESTVSAGEGVYFDGHFVSCRPGALWARLAVEKRQSRLLLWSGLFLIAAGVVSNVLKKGGSE